MTEIEQAAEAAVVVDRSSHSISRRRIPENVLKVLYRLHRSGYRAYLCGGSVRDLLMNREPKDFDIATDAHPMEIRRLFRNSRIIGRRFRLVHVIFQDMIVEVSTFRREPERSGEEGEDLLITDDNTFGSPLQDARRRDFTINALFYDIATYSIIDYVGGLQDLENRIIRSIGDPGTRFLEDPVRMLRAVVFASRLDFAIDQPILDAFETHRHEIGRAAPARLMEEYFKILRSGAAAKTFGMLKDTRLLREITPELDAAGDALWESLTRLDRYRQQFPGAPDTLTNAILAGTLLAPLGLAGRERRFSADPLERRVELGMLPIPRRDVERLHQVLALQPRLLDLRAPFRAQRALLHRHVLQEALTWLEIHGGRPDVLEHWRALQAQPGPGTPLTESAAPGPSDAAGLRRRRRRRRRRPRSAPRSSG